ncbi:hypothetical protein E4A47_03470 [Micrococcus flavus]|uniref:Uncharacterized protein n=1 Tax=Micrococcus flavus TaxID=384602 RepID=A0A4Y8X3U1_9MICC|nr:hypothetical protein [Micrococcus flavus]MBB4882117.1 hypothetical protein [Micrococcus flavus]TFI03952.1 hypothetical protein E4A47_03470 [Micrococcus flavus]GGK50431.1 hypothetical protein GCM10007073_16900 [Micrococcus flavus]
MTGFALIVPLFTALVLTVVYAVLRTSGRLHADALRGVRIHGLVTAVAALFFTVFAGGLDQLIFSTLHADPNGQVTEHAGGWMTVDVTLWAAWGPWLLSLAGPLMVAAVHVVGQLTFPEPRGVVRRASLAPRSAGRLVPRDPALAAAVLTAALVAVLAVLAAEPSTPMLIEPVERRGTPDPDVLAHHATAAGRELLPWFALAWAATLAAVLAGVSAAARRRAVEGLTPAQDRAAREVAAHRMLRTGLWMLWLLIVAAANAVIASRDARDVLARFVPDHPSALPLGGAARVIEALGTAGPWLTLTVMVVLVLWRPRALRVLRTDRP